MSINECSPRCGDEECNFIYNRYDLRKDGDAVCYDLGDDRFVQGKVVEDTMELGLWMKHLPEPEFHALCRHVFATRKALKKIVFKNYPERISPIRSLMHGVFRAHGNHWKVLLPDSYDQLMGRMSKKFSYNIRRERRLVAEQVGFFIIRHYDVFDVPDTVVTRYFSFKKMTHGTDYHMTNQEYLKRYFVTDVYTLDINDRSEAILFSCEQTSSVYLENLTYNPSYEKYSLGTILYNEFLSHLIDKRKRCVYLGSGHQKYKSFYGGIEEYACSGCVYRSKYYAILSMIHSLMMRSLSFLKRKLKSLIIK